eukprot:scaffold247923_cov28-Tisochrysis_lutea.AAC.3
MQSQSSDDDGAPADTRSIGQQVVMGWHWQVLEQVLNSPLYPFKTEATRGAPTVLASSRDGSSSTTLCRHPPRRYCLKSAGCDEDRLHREALRPEHDANRLSCRDAAGVSRVRTPVSVLCWTPQGYRIPWATCAPTCAPNRPHWHSLCPQCTGLKAAGLLRRLGPST